VRGGLEGIGRRIGVHIVSGCTHADFTKQ
jgi:hypothetical protein